MSKLTRFITSFAAVLGAYWLYALVAVPLIEPAATRPQAGPAGDTHRAAARRMSTRLGDLQQLVPPEARAQLETPWIIESDDFKLLMQKYTNREDGRVLIEPCVLIYTPGSSKENAEPKPPIVLYAPAGAMMVFGRPLDLRTGDVARPTSGRLLGEITITSPGASSGPEDDLQIVTRDVQLTADQISTTNIVHFRYGASFGSGRNLVIKLQHDKESRGPPGDPPDIQGIESFELLELEHLHLEPPKKDEPAATAESQERPAGLDTKRPLEITCQGKFRFDLVRQFAKFHDRVNVLQLNPDGPADQLNCELLTLHFSRSRKGLVNLDGKQALPRPLGMENTDLQLREIEATGNPVIVRAFSRDAEARGERLSYDMQQDCVVLEGGDEVHLREGPNEIHARSIRYKSKGKERLGEIFSQGPGRMKGKMRDRPGQEISVEWGDRLQLEPFDDQHLATLSGGVKLDYADAGVGTLTAERIDLWLFELPPGPKREKLEIAPDRMLVQNQVKINSPEVFGNVNRLEIWFEEGVDGSPVTPPEATGGASGSAESDASSASPVAGSLEPRATGQPTERRYHVRGDLAQARFLVHNKKANLAELMLEGEVLLDEIPLVRSNDQPMHVEGDRIQVFQAHDTTKTVISVIGRLAVFRGRGMTLSGTNINVDAGTNRLWIDGSGEMMLPMDRDLKGEPVQHGGVLTITWQKEMDFDGLNARFHERVVAWTQNQRLQTELLDVQFAEKVDFRNVRSKSRPETDLEQIVCRGGVFMEGRTYEKNISPQPASAGGSGFVHSVSLPPGVGTRPRRQESWEEFQAAELTINRRTGAIFAQGPGRITTIRLKSNDLLAARRGQIQSAEAAPATDDKLAYLHVEFPQMMTGNIEVREATFHERVRCVYEEVDSWQARLDVHDPDSLSEAGVLLTADRLTVAEAPAPVAGTKSIELEALGNVTAENATFTARANRMTFSEAKEWLILEGNGYAPAELSFQEYVGASSRRYPAGKICFWPKTKDVKIIDGRSLQVDGLPVR